MNSEQLKLFQTVCFITLMQHGEGLLSKHPDYIKEKLKATQDPFAAWKMLDCENMGVVYLWAKNFNFPLSDCLYEISKGLIR